jgi:MFS family permease
VGERRPGWGVPRSARLRAAFPALESPVYRRYLLAGVFATIGAFMGQTAQGWLVLELTNSPGLLGLAGAAFGLPTLFLALFAGVLADRVDRRRLLVWTYTAAALFAFVLALLTTLGWVEYWHVLVIAALAGLTFTIQQPANQAIVSTIVDRQAIGNAVALNSAQYNLLRIIAPALAGLFIAAGALELGFWANALAFAIVAIIFARLRIPSTRQADRAQAALWLDLQDGVRYLASNRVLATIVLLPAVPALLVLNYLTFIPVYARDILQIGPEGIGLLTGAIGIGALTGALSLATLRPSGGSGRLILGAMVIVGLSLTTFAVSRNVVLSMLALVLIGMFQVQFYSTTNVLIQVLVPVRLRGRVLSLYLLTSIGLIPIANVVGGSIAEAVGVEAVLAAGGILTIAIAIATAIFERPILHLRAAHLSASAAPEHAAPPARPPAPDPVQPSGDDRSQG